MKLIIVRHGKCEGLKEHITNGWRDFPLTKEGIEESKLAGVNLKNKYKDIKFDKVYTSYISRTYDTAKNILKVLSDNNIKIIQDIRLNERHYGFFQGMKKEESIKYKEYNTLSNSYKKLDNKLIELTDEEYIKQLKEYEKKLNISMDKLKDLLPRSESIKDVELRVKDFLNDILVKENKDKTILIVTHANPIKLITKEIEKLTYKETTKLRFATCGMKIYDLDYNIKTNRYVIKNIENINAEWKY